jgi:ABC-2 type transport system ATP-binding protein
MDNIMHAENLTKRYGDRIVVDGVGIEVNGGEIFGLFGPNGSGKSTILRMLTGITRPSRGTVTIGLNGRSVKVSNDPLLVREHASILTETPALYENMELYQYLRFYARLSRIPADDLSRRVLEAVTIVGMEDHLYRPLRQMSMGERQRVEIARVLIKNSPIMFLDEPFNGIDITTRREIRDYLKNVWLNEDRCVFFTSHNLLESEHFVDRFSFIYQGKIIASGDEDELKARFSTTKYAIHCTDESPGRKPAPPLSERIPTGVHPGAPADIIQDEDLPVMSGPQRGLAILVSNGLIEEGEVTGNRLIVTLSAKSELDSVIQTLVTNGVSFQEVHPVGTIEDIFINMLDEKKKEEDRPIRDSYDDRDDDPEDPYNDGEVDQ